MKGWQTKAFPTVTDNTPSEDGIYAVEVYHGWKLLEWRKDSWWHPECVGPWTAGAPVQWLGPLPPLMGQKGAETPEKVFDL